MSPDTIAALSPQNRTLLDRMEAVLDRVIRPELHSEGGAMEIIGIDEDQIVQVRLLGACQGCSSAAISLAMSIESILKAEIPELRFLEPVP